MNEVRRKMLFGEKVKECKDCYRHETLTESSSRTQSNRQYINDIEVHKAVNSFLTKKTVSINNLKSLELRLGNTCNLSCNSCWGYSSSKVNEERIRILDKEKTNLPLNNLWKDEYQVPKNINRWYKTQQYQKNIETAATNLNRIYLTGGEPTLIKENRILLRNLIETNNTNCFVSFTTNGTTADSELLDLIKNFPRNEIQISIDGVGDQASYIRHPIQWDDFNQNVKKILDIDSIKIVFYTVLSAYNLFSLSAVLRYVDQISEFRPVGWYPIFLDNPNFLRTSIWSKTIRETAVDHLKTEIEKCKNLKLYVGNEVFEKIYDYYLLRTINKYKPKFIMINLSGTIQEPLALFIIKNLKYKPIILCTGAALSFFTGMQAPINNFIDNFYLGWLLRIIFNPIRNFPRIFLSIKLCPLFSFV